MKCLNFLNFLLTGNHSKPSNISRVISWIYCIGQEMHSGCLGSWFKGRSYQAWSQVYYLVKCNCLPCSKVPSVTTHSSGNTLTLVSSSWRIWKTSQVRLEFRYKSAWTASNQGNWLHFIFLFYQTYVFMLLLPVHPRPLVVLLFLKFLIFPFELKGCVRKLLFFFRSQISLQV